MGTDRRANTGPPSILTADHEARRHSTDQLARERARSLPAWTTTPLDKAVALGLVDDDEIPSKPREIMTYVLMHEHEWDALRYVAAVGIVELKELRKMSPGARALIAHAVHQAGPNLAGRVAALRAELIADG